MDFSQYGGASEEWLAIEKELPALAFDISQPPEVLKKTVNDGREELAANFMKVLGPKVTMKDYTIPTRDGSSIQARTYRSNTVDSSAKLPVFLYYHGGGFLFGTLDTENATCSNIAINTGVLVLNVNYRHTPEHRFPVPWHDAQDAYAWLQDNIDTVGGVADQVVVGGISAGGQLSASLVLEQHLGHALQKYPKIAGQILMIPALAHMDTYSQIVEPRLSSPSVSSQKENENAPLLPVSVVRYFTDLLQTGVPDIKDTKLNVAAATPEEVKGMPPAVFGIAGLDPLRDEGLLYAQTLAEAGVATDTYLFKGMPHGARRFGEKLSVNRDWDEVMQKGISWCLKKPEAGDFKAQVRGP